VKGRWRKSRYPVAAELLAGVLDAVAHGLVVDAEVGSSLAGDGGRLTGMVPVSRFTFACCLPSTTLPFCFSSPA
jgi:hypothetical protein